MSEPLTAIFLIMLRNWKLLRA